MSDITIAPCHKDRLCDHPDRTVYTSPSNDFLSHITNKTARELEVLHGNSGLEYGKKVTFGRSVPDLEAKKVMIGLYLISMVSLDEYAKDRAEDFGLFHPEAWITQMTPSELQQAFKGQHSITASVDGKGGDSEEIIQRKAELMIPVYDDLPEGSWEEPGVDDQDENAAESSRWSRKGKGKQAAAPEEMQPETDDDTENEEQAATEVKSKRSGVRWRS